jgi:hypothetical protein
MRVAKRAKRRTALTPGYELTPAGFAIVRDYIESRGPGRPMAYRLNADHTVTPLGIDQLGACNCGAPEARVAFDDLGGPCYASTVFVGVPQARMTQILTPEAPPLLFETMARIGPRGEDEIRRFYATWEEAHDGHFEIMAEHFALKGSQ